MAETKVTNIHNDVADPAYAIEAAVRAARELQSNGSDGAVFPQGTAEIRIKVEGRDFKVDIHLIGASVGARGNAAPALWNLTPAFEPRLRGEVTHGIDVSHHNGVVNWTAVAQSGQRYVFLKASEGGTFRDSRFPGNWTASRDAGILRGAYHYFRPNVSVAAQVDNFVSTVGALESTDLPPVLDLEERFGWTVPAPQRAALAHEWLSRVHRLLACRPIVYTSRSFMRDVLGDSDELSLYPLRVAHYTNSSSPVMPSGWSTWHFWQYSETGMVPGVGGRVDLNRFAGSAAELEEFVSNQQNSTPEEISWAT